MENESDIRPRASRDEVYQVILTEGERLTSADRRDIPRLEADFRINEEGRLLLHAVIPGVTRNRVLLWKAIMHRDRTGGPFYAVLENGRLTTYRAEPGKPEVKIFETPAVSGDGPFSLGITASKNLVILSECDGQERQIVWKSDN